MKLEGKVAIVTGAASGFGRAIAERFVLEGAQRRRRRHQRRGRARRSLPAIGDKIHPVQGDVSQKADVDAMVRPPTEAFGGLDIVVNNAGITHRNQPLLDGGRGRVRPHLRGQREVDLSVDARRSARRWRSAAAASIINTASTAGVRPRPGLTWYNGSKGAVITLTKSMAAELAPKNIRVNAINPVMGETGMLERVHGRRPTRRRTAPSSSPAFRSAGMSSPHDIANAAVFLADPASAFITGVAIEVDGGRCI